jgi:hypothetical protein
MDITNGVNCGPIVLKDCYAHNCQSYGIEVTDSTDTALIHCYAAGVYLYHLTSSLITQCYFGNYGGDDSLVMDDCQRVRISELKIDSPSHNGIVIQNGCNSLVFSNVEIKEGAQLSANNTYYGIKIVDGTYCIFNAVSISMYSATDRLKYGIEETAPSDFNLFDSIIVHSDTALAGIHKTGGSSVTDGSIYG